MVEVPVEVLIEGEKKYENQGKTKIIEKEVFV